MGIVSRVVATQMAIGWPWSLVKGGKGADSDTESPEITTGKHAVDNSYFVLYKLG